MPGRETGSPVDLALSAQFRPDMATKASSAQWADSSHSALSDSNRCFRHNAAKPYSPAYRGVFA